MNAANGFISKVAAGLAVAAIIGGATVYAQVRDNTSDLEKAERVHKEIRDDLKEISGNQADIRESVAKQSGKVDAIYDVIVKDQ